MAIMFVDKEFEDGEPMKASPQAEGTHNRFGTRGVQRGKGVTK